MSRQSIRYSPHNLCRSSALRGLKATGEIAYQCTLEYPMVGVIANQGFSGLLMEENVDQKNYSISAGMLSGSGLPNLARRCQS